MMNFNPKTKIGPISKFAFFALFAFALLPFSATSAQSLDEGENTDEIPFDAESWKAYQVSIEASLDWKIGTQIVADEKVQLELPDDLRFLNKIDAQKVLTQLWGNPENDAVLGMIFSANCQPSRPECWGAVLTYEADGHVDDDDASEIDYDDLLEEMQEGAKASNEERTKLGYETIEIKGWASVPFYDAESKKLHWAKEIYFEGNETNTLNYNLRVLGREGVFVLNVVSGMEELASVKEAVNELTQITHFTEGNRYSDYNPATDHLAEYGIAALIGGKVLAKGGILKGLLALLLAGKKFIIVGAIAIAGLFKKLAGRKSEA